MHRWMVSALEVGRIHYVSVESKVNSGTFQGLVTINKRANLDRRVQLLQSRRISRSK